MYSARIIGKNRERSARARGSLVGRAASSRTNSSRVASTSQSQKGGSGPATLINRYNRRENRRRCSGPRDIVPRECRLKGIPWKPSGVARDLTERHANVRSECDGRSALARLSPRNPADRRGNGCSGRRKRKLLTIIVGVDRQELHVGSVEGAVSVLGSSEVGEAGVRPRDSRSSRARRGSAAVGQPRHARIRSWWRRPRRSVVGQSVSRTRHTRASRSREGSNTRERAEQPRRKRSWAQGEGKERGIGASRKTKRCAEATQRGRASRVPSARRLEPI